MFLESFVVDGRVFRELLSAGYGVLPGTLPGSSGCLGRKVFMAVSGRSCRNEWRKNLYGSNDSVWSGKWNCNRCRSERLQVLEEKLRHSNSNWIAKTEKQGAGGAVNIRVQCFLGIRADQLQRVMENRDLGYSDAVVIHVGTNDVRRLETLTTLWEKCMTLWTWQRQNSRA